MNNKQVIPLADFYIKYSDVEFKFSHYYKFTFYFIGESSDGETVIVAVGGTAEEIYQEDVTANKTYSIYELKPCTGESDSVCFSDTW